MALALPGDLNSSRTERALLDDHMGLRARLLVYLEWGALSPTVTSLFD